MKNEMKGIKSKNIFWGAFLLLAAAFLIVNQLGVIEGVGLFSALFTVFWVAVLVDGVIRRSFGKILFAIAFICIIFDEPLGIEAITPWTVLAAALLGTIGLNMIFKRKKHFYYEGNWEKRGNGYFDDKIIDVEVDSENMGSYGTSQQTGGQDDSRFYCETHFGSAVKYVNSSHFEYASLECSFGAMKVYFDNAQILKGSATIDLDVSFGGVELYIPKHWAVINQTDTAFGGIDEKNRCESTGSPVVTITGDVSFSGVTIIYI